MCVIMFNFTVFQMVQITFTI